MIRMQCFHLQRFPKAHELEFQALFSVSKRRVGAQALSVSGLKHRNDVAGRFGHYQQEFDESLRDSRGYWLRAASGKFIN